MTRYSIWTSTFRFIWFFKKRQHLITIGGDEFGLFRFKGQRYKYFLKTGAIVLRFLQVSFGPIVEKRSWKVFDKAVGFTVIQTPFRLNSLPD